MNRMLSMVCTVSFTAVCLLASSTRAQSGTIYAEPSGQAKGTGTEESPLDLRVALARAAQDTNISEVILLSGVYTDSYRLDGSSSNSTPRLVIRAEDPGEAIISHGVLIETAEPVPGVPNALLVKRDGTRLAMTSVWERDRRIRYRELASISSVGAVPASYFYDPESGNLYIHTPDGKFPGNHHVFFSRNTSSEGALSVYRPNTLIEGLHFKDCAGEFVIGIRSDAADVVARYCHFDNVDLAWRPYTRAHNNICEDCTGIDVTMFMFAHGQDDVVRRCRMEKIRDKFMRAVNETWDNGLYVYSPARGGVFEYNVIKGYRYGCRAKALHGGVFLARHNTIIGAFDDAISIVSGYDKGEAAYNIIVEPGAFVAAYFNPDPKKLQVHNNLVWAPVSIPSYYAQARALLTQGIGCSNLLANPRFVNPDKGDYRLFPDSPALLLKGDNGRPAGAMEMVDWKAAVNTPPKFTIRFQADSQSVEGAGELWNGNQFIRDIFPEEQTISRITANRTVAVELKSPDESVSLMTVKTRIGDNPAEESPWRAVHRFLLPEQDGEYKVRFAVKSSQGSWSEDVETIIRLVAHAAVPRLIDPPRISASAGGVLVEGRSDQPVFAHLKYGKKTCDREIKHPLRVIHEWSSFERWRVPVNEFVFVIQEPEIKPGEKIQLQVELEGLTGHAGTSSVISAVAEGAARTLFVSPQGGDIPANGTRQSPFGTIQYAVDRAIPGDRVILLPGTYAKPAIISRGGVSEKARITIEAEKPGDVTIDCANLESAAFRLEKAPFVTIRNLRLLYPVSACVYIHESPHSIVDNCAIYTGGGYVTSEGVFVYNSPNATVSRSLVIGGKDGIVFIDSPGATVRNNTISRAMYNSVYYNSRSVRGSVMVNNSMGLGGNAVYTLSSGSKEDLAAFRSDYNNLGTCLLTHNQGLAKSDPQRWAKMQKEAFTVNYVNFHVSSKTIAIVPRPDQKPGEWWCLTFDELRKASGQEKHSIFADPKYIRPTPPIDTWNWHVQTNSPNLGAGESGADIGCFGAAQQ